MAIFRKVHTSFWSDPFIQDLTIEQRYFYLYLLTNEQTKQCGVYEITRKQISFDTGYSMDKVSVLLKYFISKGKIRYNEDTKEMALGKWLKYNNSSSPKIKSCIAKEFEQVKDRVLIEYVRSMDTSSQEEEEQEEEEEQKEDKKKFVPDFDSLPLNYRQSLITWWNYKEQIKSKYVQAGWDALVKSAIRDFTPEEFSLAVERSMANGWKGIFSQKSDKPEVTITEHQPGGGRKKL